MRIWLMAALILAGVTARAWIDYGEKVEPAAAAFGKSFAGVSLKLETRNGEAELNAPEAVSVLLKNENERSGLLPEGLSRENRSFALYLIFATAGGASFFTQNLLIAPDNPVLQDRLAPHAVSTIFEGSLEKLTVVRVDKMNLEAPGFPEGNAVLTRELVPQAYVLQAILVSRIAGKKPDFVAASNTWKMLLLPERGEHMSEAERQARAEKYLARLREGAYGGIAVSSQLAALGETAVPQLIEIADRQGDGHTLESRAWAIATLCRTGSPRAAEYIRERLKHPVDLRDLPFLAWHSQGCRAPAVESEVQALVASVLKGERLPWQEVFPEVSDGVRNEFLEYAFKHFRSTGQPLAPELAERCLTWPDAKAATFGLETWKPMAADTALPLLVQAFAQHNRPPNFKRTILRKLEELCVADNVPRSGAATDTDAAWRRAGLWLIEKGQLRSPQLGAFLRAEVVAAKTATAQREIIGLLQTHLPEEFPVKPGAGSADNDWRRTWQWALGAPGVTREEAVAFLCRQVRAAADGSPTTQKALLTELRKWLGIEFPLEPGTEVRLPVDWEKGMSWLNAKGYLRN